MPSNRVMFLRAFELYRVAIRAYRKLRPEDANSTARTDALVPILFSAATLEAYIMELAAAAQGDAEQGYPIVGELFTSVAAAEESRRSTVNKFKIALKSLDGSAYDESASPFVDFAALFELRNDIVHLKPYLHAGLPRKLAAFLHGKGLCGDPMQEHAWLSIISTPQVARWACETVPAIVDTLAERLPATLRGTTSLCREVSERYRDLWDSTLGKVE